MVQPFVCVFFFFFFLGGVGVFAECSRLYTTAPIRPLRVGVITRWMFGILYKSLLS